jgi:HEPN domain-containing protein
MGLLIKEWLDSAQDDMRDAGILFQEKSYKNCVLHCHQAIEKILKAIMIKNNQELIRTHDLVSLVNFAKLSLPKNILAIIDCLNPHYLPAKYPDVVFKFNYSKARVSRILKETKEVFKWLRLELSQN